MQYTDADQNGLHVIVQSVAGSRLYGTHREDSDHDIRGVCLAPISAVIGLDPTFEQLEETEPADRVLTELRKFLSLALNNNPNILDTLFAPPDMWREATEEWEDIYRLRHSVLSQKVRKTYVGYANAQLQRIEGHAKWLQKPPEEPDIRNYGFYNEKNAWTFFDQEFAARYRERKKNWDNYQAWLQNRNPARHALEVKYGYDTKHAGHLFRLVLQGQAILRDGDFSPVLAGGDLAAVKLVMCGGFTYDELIKTAEEEFEKIDRMPSSLPDAPSRDTLSEVVQRIYARQIDMAAQD
jgi:predicted nucleotidyltransferase